MRDKPAFPFPYPGAHGEPVDYGLSRRELFAAMAMQGIVGNPEVRGNFSGSEESIIAKAAVTIADALIAELEGAG